MQGGLPRRSRERERLLPTAIAAQGVLNRNLDWLQQRWKVAEAERQAGQLKSVPPWFFDEPTDRQLDRLEREGVRVTRGNLTKGKASDVIGLFEEPDGEDLEKLRFFKGPTKDMNQTRARHEVARLMADAETREAWENRPPDPMLKEEMRLYGLSVPKGATHVRCVELREARRTELEEKDPTKLEQLYAQWGAYESLMDEFSDREFREDYEIKELTFALVKQAADAVHARGTPWEDIDPGDVADKLKELKPELDTAR